MDQREDGSLLQLPICGAHKTHGSFTSHLRLTTSTTPRLRNAGRRKKTSGWSPSSDGRLVRRSPHNDNVVLQGSRVSEVLRMLARITRSRPRWFSAKVVCIRPGFEKRPLGQQGWSAGVSKEDRGSPRLLSVGTKKKKKGGALRHVPVNCAR